METSLELVWNDHKSSHKAPHMGDLIEFNLTASEPIIGVIYNCFFVAFGMKAITLFKLFGQVVISNCAILWTIDGRKSHAGVLRNPLITRRTFECELFGYFRWSMNGVHFRKDGQRTIIKRFLKAARKKSKRTFFWFLRRERKWKNIECQGF